MVAATLSENRWLLNLDDHASNSDILLVILSMGAPQPVLPAGKDGNTSLDFSQAVHI